MSLILLCGSGISIPTFGDIGSTVGLTFSMLHYKWFRHTDSSYLPGSPKKISYAPEYYEAETLQEFLRRLKFFAEDYYRLRSKNPVTYEDLYYLTDQLDGEESGNIDNPAIEPFRREIINRVHDLVIKTHNPNYKTLGSLSKEAAVFIKCAVSHYLYTNDRPVGMEFLKDVIGFREQESIHVFTLNHDILFESFLQSIKTEFVDGFGKFENSVRWFDRKLFNKCCVLRLFKLHGSVNWYNLYNKENGGIGIPTWTNDAEPTDGDGNRFYPSTHPIILSGTYNKERRYYFDIFAEMHRRFYQALRNPNTNLIIITGYGWNDRSINGRLREWVGQSTKNKFLIIHKEPEKLKNESKSLLWYDFDRFKENKKLFVIEKWPSELEEGELLERIISCSKNDTI